MKRIFFVFLPLCIALSALALSCRKEIPNSTNTVYIDEIQIVPDEITLLVDGTAHLKTKIIPSNTSNKKVFWESGDPSVVSVDETKETILGYSDKDKSSKYFVFPVKYF